MAKNSRKAGFPINALGAIGYGFHNPLGLTRLVSCIFVGKNWYFWSLLPQSYHY
jgi:hypothetical protein